MPAERHRAGESLKAPRKAVGALMMIVLRVTIAWVRLFTTVSRATLR